MIKLVTSQAMDWPSISSELAKVVEHAQGDFTLSDLFYRLCSGQYQLWQVEGRGWAITKVKQYTHKRTLLIVALVGKHVIRRLQNDINFKTLVSRTFGVTEMEAMCRPSMVTLVQRYGWKPKYQVVTLDLGEI